MIITRGLRVPGTGTLAKQCSCEPQHYVTMLLSNSNLGKVQLLFFCRTMLKKTNTDILGLAITHHYHAKYAMITDCCYY